jgi:hypothetical protein
MSNDLIEQLNIIIEKTENYKVKWQQENLATYFVYDTIDKNQMSIQHVQKYNTFIFQVKNIESKQTLYLLTVDPVSNKDVYDILSILYKSIEKNNSKMICEEFLASFTGE